MSERERFESWAKSGNWKSTESMWAAWEARALRSANAEPSTEAQILAAKIVTKRGEFADLFTASTAALLLASEILRIAYPRGVPVASGSEREGQDG